MEFQASNASRWFSIMNAQFRIANIKESSTKFFHILGNLPFNIVSRLPQDVIDKEEFETLRAAVLKQVEKSKPELFESLTATSELTGRPSIFLNELLKTGEQVGIGEEFIRHKFLQALPPAISPVLAAQTTLNITQLGTLADELITFASHRSQSVVAVQSNNSTEPSSSSTTMHYGVRPFKPSQRPVVCRAHLYYGQKARTCRNWCTWPNKKSVRVEPNSRAQSPSPENEQALNGKGASSMRR